MSENPLKNKLQCQRVFWETSRATLLELRFAVFTMEQQVDPVEDEDGLDPQCLHALAFWDGHPVATGRVAPDGKIGRLCVLREYRNRGVGSALFGFLLEMAREPGNRSIRIHAQLHAAHLYEKFGFRTMGEPFMEAGIPHVKMVLPAD